jgi:hypothetical protein
MKWSAIVATSRTALSSAALADKHELRQHDVQPALAQR